MAVALVISIVGYTLLITLDLSSVGLTYFAIFMTTVGVRSSTSRCYKFLLLTRI
jgi:hypothetical protein